MKRLDLRHVLGLIGVALIGALAGCAAQGNVARAQTAVVVPGGPGQLAAMARYVQGIRRQLRSDRVVNGILGRAHVVTPFAMLAVVTPKGFVQKAGVQAGMLPVAVSTALIDHVVNVNFGSFPPGMPDRPLAFEFPMHPVVGAPMAPEGSVFRQQTIVVYQPNQVLVARVGSAVPLANYVKQLDASLGAMFDAMAPETG